MRKTLALAAALVLLVGLSAGAQCAGQRRLACGEHECDVDHERHCDFEEIR